MTTSINFGIANVSRRDMLKAGAALTLAVALPLRTRASAAATNAADATMNAFVRISSDNTVTVIAKHIEMGQGAYTGLATLVADELDADWDQIKVEGAPADAAKYGNKLFGGAMGTGGSTSIASSYDLMRQSGAAARAMLVSAAASKWQVPASEITVKRGRIEHAASHQSATFGDFAADAAKLPLPKEVKLKDPQNFVLIGKNAARIDAREKSNGKAIFTQDIHFPGMLTAAVLHPPLFGATVKSVDDSAAKAIPGVEKVFAYKTPVRSGVAVLAKDFWTAKKGRDALKVEWDESAAYKGSTEDMLAEYRSLATKPGEVARRDGDFDAAIATAAKVIEAVYEFPYLAHASMEPLNCVVQLKDGACEVWNGEQFQSIDQGSIAQAVGVPPQKVKLNMLYAGGSFGRRANPQADYTVEAATIAKLSGLAVPVKMVWTREDDMRAAYYRPAYVHSLTAGLDKEGKIIAWRHRIVGQSIMDGSSFSDGAKIDQTSVEGAATLPYAIPNLLVELHTTKVPVPIQWWRSVGSTHTAFATEAFLDDIARATNADPYQLRRGLLAKHKNADRYTRVLDLVVQQSGWSKPRKRGETLGLAIHESFNTVVGQVAHVTKTANGLRLERVTCAVDCGIAVNPNIVAMQMESGIGYGLSAALTGAITLKDGKVVQGNFDDYPVLRMNQMPAVDVHIVPSTNPPTGVGEPGTPPIAPAVANAIASATGKPIHVLPFESQGIKLAPVHA